MLALGESALSSNNSNPDGDNIDGDMPLIEEFPQTRTNDLVI